MQRDTDILRALCDIWDRHGSGLLALHGQSGDMMFQGCTSENVQKAFDEINELGFDMVVPGHRYASSMSCVGAARCEHSCFSEAAKAPQGDELLCRRSASPGVAHKFKFKFQVVPTIA